MKDRSSSMVKTLRKCRNISVLLILAVFSRILMMGTAATMGIDENMALAMRRGKSRGLRIGITTEGAESVP